MKVGFLASIYGQKNYMDHYLAIVACLRKKGHEVEHSFHLHHASWEKLTYNQRENLYLEYLDNLMQCDVIVAECSTASTLIGYGLALLKTHGKPLIILFSKGAEEIPTTKDLFSSVENIIMLEYELDSVSRVLEEGFVYIEPHLDKRFTIIFPSHLLSKVESIAHQKKLPKAVFIRQLIEEKLEKEGKL